jgi:ribosomal protein S18 acetylase RimI-like enzyme
MDLEIRPYREGDLEAVSALWNRVFSDAPAWNIPEADIHRKLSVQRELFLVALVDRQVVGTAMGGFDGHRGWVYYVAVGPEHRHRGVGRALMQGVEKGLMQLGCPKLNLQVRSTNDQAVSFYRRLGYRVEDRISLSKRLDAENDG